MKVLLFRKEGQTYDVAFWVDLKEAAGQVRLHKQVN